MILYPAIDIYEGRAVRLLRGDYARVTVYGDDPAAIARDFRAAGAQWAHVVDLEAARDGGAPNFPAVERVLRVSGLKVEVGGGIRSPEAVERYLSAGAARVILGTAAVENADFLAAMAREYGRRIAVGVDARDGMVALRGWTETSAVGCLPFLRRIAGMGVSAAIVTDISRDGAMRGTNRALYAEIARDCPEMDIVASGGVSGMEDLMALKALGLSGAIVGKAYYEGAIDLKEAVRAVR